MNLAGLHALARRLHRDTRGVETVELALVLPVLLLLALGTFPLLDLLATHRDVARAADQVALYASRVDPNPTANAECGGLTRRRSYAEVEAMALAAVPDLTEVSVSVGAPGAPPPPAGSSASDSPCAATALSRVHVRLRAERSTGPLAATVNAVAGLLGGGPVLPATATASASATAHLE